MMFQDPKHERRYLEIITKMENDDEYHSPVAYLFALNDDCYKHINDLYDFEERCIKPRTAFHHDWQTGTSAKTTRLAYNLWNGTYSSISENGEDILSSGFTPNDIFCSSLAPYFWEAVKLRYPNYCNEDYDIKIKNNLQDMFDNREIAVMSMTLSAYISSEWCPETPKLKEEIWEIIRKLNGLNVC